MSSLPNQNTNPPPVPNNNWRNNATPIILQRALGQDNDQKSDNSKIDVVAISRRLEHGSTFIEYDIRGSKPTKDRKRSASSYIVRASSYGVRCNCPHAKEGFTCKHCIYVLLNEIDVPKKDVLSTMKCQERLSQYLSSSE
jgi:hypothetical protein